MRIVGITGGVDTHADNHVTAAIDHNGGLLGVESVPATETGYEDLLVWLVGFGEVVRVGVEGTGSWGVGLTRFLRDQEVVVVEVDRLNRQNRRKVGKSDPTDAVSAARAALSATATVTPKSRNGRVEEMRVLLVGRRFVCRRGLDPVPTQRSNFPRTHVGRSGSPYWSNNPTTHPPDPREEPGSGDGVGLHRRRRDSKRRQRVPALRRSSPLSKT